MSDPLSLLTTTSESDVNRIELPMHESLAIECAQSRPQWKLAPDKISLHLSVVFLAVLTIVFSYRGYFVGIYNDLAVFSTDCEESQMNYPACEGRQHRSPPTYSMREYGWSLDDDRGRSAWATAAQKLLSIGYSIFADILIGIRDAVPLLVHNWVLSAFAARGTRNRNTSRID